MNLFFLFSMIHFEVANIHIFLYFSYLCSVFFKIFLMPNTVLNTAVRALRQGLTLLYPTDTLWGVGCDATMPDAVDKIYTLKQRDPAKAMLVLASVAMLRYDMPRPVTDLLLRSPRPTTVVMPATWLTVTVANNLPAADGTLGVRVPHMDFCQQLLESLGHPIVSTSANLSGTPSPQRFSDISDAIKKAVDYVVPAFLEAGSSGSASHIVKAMPDGSLSVIR